MSLYFHGNSLHLNELTPSLILLASVRWGCGSVDSSARRFNASARGTLGVLGSTGRCRGGIAYLTEIAVINAAAVAVLGSRQHPRLKGIGRHLLSDTSISRACYNCKRKSKSIESRSEFHFECVCLYFCLLLSLLLFILIDFLFYENRYLAKDRYRSSFSFYIVRIRYHRATCT